MSLYNNGLTLGEGPQWHDGALWVSDPQKGGIWTDSGGTWAFTPLATPTNGLCVLPDGRLVGAVIDEKRVGLWDGAGFGPYADLSAVATGPLGDMVGDRQGGLYVDDVGYAALRGQQPRPGRLIYVNPRGRARVAARDVDFPNGLAIIDEGRTLVVAETWAQRLTAFTIGPAGQLTDRRLFADLAAVVDPEARPDGMCATEHGVWVCTLTAHSVAFVDRSGQLVQTIDTGGGSPVACCLGPAGRLFVTVAETGGAPILEAIANKAVKTHVDVYEPAAMLEAPGGTRTGGQLAGPPIQALLAGHDRIGELEQRNRELEEENAFLKKAAVYFAKQLA
ncbi:MAG TPA: SMP-30/gluconolactonase/LRE family protein [Trebonia sp.]|nr:SMP-30/gluconolactonase/LRE family protein [Trebonia sp.]